MTSAFAQLRALLALRWQMVRTPGVRLSIVLAGIMTLWLLSVVARSSAALEPAALTAALALAPAAFLGFGVLAVAAPLSSGGGNELVPPDQLVGFPVRPTTQFLGGLALAPLNLVWVVQLLALTAETAYLTIGTSLLRGALTTAAYVLCATALGQAVAWVVSGLRQTRGGRRTVGGLVLLLAVTAVVVVRAGRGRDLLEHSPTRAVVTAISRSTDTGRWALTTGLLMALGAVGLLGGAHACAWALRRPGDLGSLRHTRPVRRRPAPGSALRALVCVDRASVWRAPALRRGGLVLLVLPGIAASGAAVPWSTLVVLPGLVAAGAGLLFGVNAFCLDASGAVWLASLPHPPALVARAKTLVLTETVLAAVTVAAVTGSLRSPGSPTAAELTAIVSSGLACTAVVVAICLRSSVRRPHRADLGGPRDAVAPPGALCFASVVLAAPAAAVGMVLESASTTGYAWLPPLLALPMIVGAGLVVKASLQRYDQPLVRSRVVQVVSAG